MMLEMSSELWLLYDRRLRLSGRETLDLPEKKMDEKSGEPSGEGGHCCMLNSFLLLTDITDTT